ncbi:MAG: type II toxin-antitoxin system RelE/ParE family toxin [Bacteroidota bacterium]
MEIQYARKAEKFLDTLHDPLASRIKRAILNLALNPRPAGYIKLSGDLNYRIRVGDYRIVYQVQDKALLVLIVNIGHRSVVYD